MNLPLLSFKQLVTLFTSLGPHKHRELSRFAGVSPDIVAQWAQGIARPDPASEQRHRHYLLSKLSDVKQLREDHDAQKEDLKRAEATVDRAAASWDLHLDELRDNKASEGAIEKAEERKSKAVATLRDRLGLMK